MWSGRLAVDESDGVLRSTPAYGLLAPGFTYDDLDDIAGGSAAAAAFLALATSEEMDAAEQKRIRDALVAYCKRDTMAMVEVHRALNGL